MVSNRVIASDEFDPFSFAWPTTKQSELLHLVRIGQAVTCVVFCVLLGVESAGGLIITTVLEPDPEASGSTASACANETGHKFELSFR